MRKAEGGQRINLGCRIFKQGKLKKFHPLAPLSSEWEEWYINSRNIKLCELYYPPYNLYRTGCVGCPFNIHIQRELDMLKAILPHEYAKAERIWKPVYAEYRRIGYRLRKEDNQMTIFDFIKEQERSPND